MKQLLSLLFMSLVLTSCSTQTVKEEKKEDVKYEENWESMSAHNEAPDWFSDAKFGIYFHWGVYSVPAHYSEWYPFFMYRDNKVKEYHEKTYGKLGEFDYHDFVPMFTGEQFNAEEWAQLMTDAGAKFGGPCSQHHDGFAMWDSKVNPWNSTDKGPKKDITGEMEKALKARGLKFISTFHHARNLQRHEGDPEKFDTYHSHFAHVPGTATADTDAEIAKMYGNIPAAEFNEYWFEQLKEVIDQYSPDIIWFDVWLRMIPLEYRQKFAAYYLNEAKKKNQEVIIAYKQAAIPKSVGVLDIEQGGKRDMSESAWLTDITLSNKSWSYVEGQTYKSPSMVVRNMIDVWSKNGVVLLNISPTADGVINKEQRDILKRVGEWMKKHSEAVYETRPYSIKGFGHAKAEDGAHGGQSATQKYTAKDARFLKSKDGKYLYLFILGKPEVGSVIATKELGLHKYYPEEGIKKITLMGSDTECKWGFGDIDFELTVPDAELDDIANVFRMELN
ncbi:alpha-L-fucosidase [Labilibacter marinus]|uniref:alpha-L-fucosidase n=1 Tax=Labilibacter marinus TaxID=1477105 RepID=UPI00094F6004|nr:alpha-L-fucosidase [Labilibacter marinus]